eukprot:763823-Hanusia_phi.AAC.1
MQIVSIGPKRLTVTRGVAGTTAAHHWQGAAIDTGVLMYSNVSTWAQIDNEVVLLAGVDSPTTILSRGARGTAALAHAQGAAVSIPSSIFSLSFSLESTLFNSFGISIRPSYNMNAAGVLGLSDFMIVKGGAGLRDKPLFDFRMNRYMDASGNLQNTDARIQEAHVFTSLTNHSFLHVDLTKTFTKRLIDAKLQYPAVYNPYRFGNNPLYFQDRMDGFDHLSPSSFLSRTSNAINASSTYRNEPGSPVYILDAYGHLLGDDTVQSQRLSIDSYSIVNEPSVLGSFWSKPSLLFTLTTSSDTTMYLHDTIASQYSNGQMTAQISSSVRMFVSKTNARQLKVIPLSSATSAPSASSPSTSTPSDKAGVPIGAIVGGVVGGVVGALLIGFIAWKTFESKAGANAWNASTLVQKTSAEIVLPNTTPQPAAFPVHPA